MRWGIEMGSYQQRVSNYAAKYGLSTAEAKTAIYQQRIKSAAARGMSKAAARGHAQTPEHGGVLRGTPRTVHAAGHTIKSMYSDASAERAINKAADNDSRIVIRVHTKSGGWIEAGGRRGYAASLLTSEIAASGDIRGAVTGGTIPGGDDYDLGDIEPDDIDAWQIDELAT